MGNSSSVERRPPEFNLFESMLQDKQATPIYLPMNFLRTITSDFSEEQVLGRGGFGVVYKGVLQNGKAIAVKKLSETTNNLDDDQFLKEVIIFFGLEHKNIVQLVGYCAESRSEVAETKWKYVLAEVRNRLLCFEYANNLSLDKHLPAESHGLEWHTGYQIVKGICRGLHYLHTECQIVHLDIKPQNILLDENMEPKITDFGMSRLFGTQKSLIITQNRGGTLGYMAPEYLENGLISIKADIFSLGVIIIELMTGSRYYPSTEENYEHFIENVVGSWRKRLETGRYKPLEKYVEQVKKCILIALMCVHAEPNKRPTAQDVIGKLTEADVTTPDQWPQGIQHASESVEPPNRPPLKRFLGLFISSSTNMLASQPESQFVHLDGAIAFTMGDLLKAEPDVLGEGTYGTVYKAMLDTGSILAVKRLRQDMIKDNEQFKAEVAVLGNVKHTNLLAFKAYFKSADEALIVFDYMPKGSLWAMLHARATDARVGWATRMAIAKGTARGLAYLHDDMSIIHGNLTAKNILLDEQSHPKIADFGLFRAMTAAANSNSMLAEAREQGYRAPELSSMTEASTKTDVYSIGIIILEHLTGKSPMAIDMPRLVASVSREEWTSEVFDIELMRDLNDVGGPSQDDLMSTLKLALQCVDPSPSARPTAREVLAELEKICPGPENVAGQGQDSSPSVQLQAQDELELEQISEHQPPFQRTEDQEVLANNWNRNFFLRNDWNRNWATWPETEDALDEFEQPRYNWEICPDSPKPDARDVFEQLGHVQWRREGYKDYRLSAEYWEFKQRFQIGSGTEDGPGALELEQSFWKWNNTSDEMGSPVVLVPTETQEMLPEQIWSRSKDDARTSAGQLGSVQIEGCEAFELLDHINGGPEGPEGARCRWYFGPMVGESTRILPIRVQNILSEFSPEISGYACTFGGTGTLRSPSTGGWRACCECKDAHACKCEWCEDP